MAGRTKCILVGRTPEESLPQHMASLGGLRRALSLPLAGGSRPGFASFAELWGAADELRSLVERWPFDARAWLVEQQVPLAYRRDWPSGSPSPGVRMVSSLFRRTGFSRAQFRDHWLGPHTEVARSYTVPVWNYSQNVVVEPLTAHAGEDGFVGMHFRTQEELASRWRDHPEEAARGEADAERFLDATRATTIYARETLWDPT